MTDVAEIIECKEALPLAVRIGTKERPLETIPGQMEIFPGTRFSVQRKLELPDDPPVLLIIIRYLELRAFCVQLFADGIRAMVAIFPKDFSSRSI